MILDLKSMAFAEHMDPFSVVRLAVLACFGQIREDETYKY